MCFLDSVSGKKLQEHMKNCYKVIGTSKTVNDEFQYFRKGTVDSSKRELSEDLFKKLDKWEKSHLEAAGVTSEELYGI